MSIALAACAPPVAPAPKPPASPLRHAQFVRALSAPERFALVERLRQRNGASWTVNEEALVRSGTVVDPFVGFLRRAKDTSHASPSTPIDEDEAAVRAAEFVRKNADLLGVPKALTLSLVPTVREATPADNAGPAHWQVKLEATFPTKGYEAFQALENEIAIEVFLDEDGHASSFVNLSKIHPRLAIDPRPGLPETDPRVFAKVVGRRVFALSEDGDPRQLELGNLEPGDLLPPKLTMQIAPGPFNAWLTYRLAWLVSASRPVESGGFFFFFYLVDTDSGEVVQDSPVPTKLLAEVP